MGMGVTIDINGKPIGRLVCQRVSGELDGWCKYRCTYQDTQAPQVFTVRHYRPSGAPALVATAMGILAEAGFGRQG